MALSFKETNILGDITNDTYGKSSTGSSYGEPRLGGYSASSTSSVATKASLEGNVMHITSLAIINLGPIGMQHQEISKCENELNQYIKKYLSEVKKEFKKKENAGRALKTKIVKDSEKTNVEMINHYASNRRAYVRRTICFEIN
jgi:hypothetical protein